jgi:hypothetical protein
MLNSLLPRGHRRRPALNGGKDILFDPGANLQPIKIVMTWKHMICPGPFYFSTRNSQPFADKTSLSAKGAHQLILHPALGFFLPKFPFLFN